MASLCVVMKLPKRPTAFRQGEYIPYLFVRKAFSLQFGTGSVSNRPITCDSDNRRSAVPRRSDMGTAERMPSRRRWKVPFFHLPKHRTVLNNSCLGVNLPLFQRVHLVVVFANHGCEKGACLDLPIHLRLGQNVERRAFGGRQLQLVRIGMFHTAGYGPSGKKVDMFGSP